MKIRLQDVKHNCITRPLLVLWMLVIGLGHLVMYFCFIGVLIAALGMKLWDEFEEETGIDGSWKKYFLRRWRRPPAKNG